MSNGFTEISASEWMDKLKSASSWAMMTDLEGCRLELVVMRGFLVEGYITPNLVAMDQTEYDIFKLQLAQLEDEIQARRIF